MYINGNWYVGGLVGFQTGNSQINGSSASGSVNGNWVGVGGLVGWQEGNSTIIGSSASGSVNGNLYVGGLVGYQTGSSEIIGSSASGSVTGSNWVGGLVGFQTDSSTITDTYATGGVNGQDSVGGLIGRILSGTAERSYATGSVSSSNATARIGGLVGTIASNGVISASYWDAETTGQSSAVGQNAGVINVASLQSSSSDAANYAFTQSSYGAFDFSDSGAWFMIDGETRPFLRSEYSTTIRTANQLQLMAMDLSADYTLANDIDLGSALSANGSMWTERGFVPIGRNTSLGSISFVGTSFSGDFVGAGHVIAGLTLHREDENYVGLFGRVDGSDISDVVLESMDINGNRNVGGLVGWQQGNSQISGSSASGSVEGTMRVGGLVGAQAGSSEIIGSSASGSVKGTTGVGGLVGIQTNSGKIIGSSASGSVEGTELVGGLVGNQAGSSRIIDTYAIGSVKGQDQVGGLIGRILSGTTERSYATGAVSSSNATARIGGLVGIIGSNAEISASYWDTETTGQETGFGVNFGTFDATGLITLAFQNTAAFMNDADENGWDFGTVWAPPSDGFYPELYALSPVIRLDAGDVNRFYGEENPDFSVTGVFGGPSAYLFGPADDSIDASGALTTSATAQSDVGFYTINASAAPIMSAGGIEYRVVSVDGTLMITPRALTVLADDAERVYGDANPEFTAQVAGLANHHADLDEAGLSLASEAIETSDVGGYGITLGGENGNYAITFNNGTLTITPRALTVTADDAERVYGDANSDFTAQVAGLANHHADLDEAGLSLESEAIETSDVGGYGITLGGENGNYAITFNNGTLTITPRALTVIREVSDRVNHGREDFWTLPMNGAGDCEDIALLKRHRLIQQGWPSSVLLMTVVRDRRGRGHAVLAAQTDRGTLILDNRTNAIRHWSDTGYTFYLIQSSRSPRQWQSINKRPTNPVTGLEQLVADLSRLPVDFIGFFAVPCCPEINSWCHVRR